MENKKALCRICLESEEAEKFIQIHALNSKVAIRIFLISGVQVVEHEEIPALICQQCVKDLNHADLIRKKCLHADEYFRSLNFEKPLELKNNTENRKHDKHESNDEKLELVKYLRNEPVTVDILIEPVRSNKRKARQKITEKGIKHPKLKTEKEKFFCSKCFKSFSDASYLKKHEYFRHYEIPVEDLFECDFCGYKSKTKQLMRNHLITVHSTKPREKFICRICGKMLSTKGNLDGHEKTHIDVDPSDYVTCPVCQKPFREKRFMVEHKKLVHEKSKAFQCPHCPHISTCKGAYNKHYKSVHLKLRDFICSDCGLGFCTNSQLTRHFRIHTGERPYECKNCSKPFRLSSHRKRHEDICPKRLLK